RVYDASVADPIREPERGRSPFGRPQHLSHDGPLVGGASREGFHSQADVFELPEGAAAGDSAQPDPRALERLLPAEEPGRAIDDWGRSETTFELAEPILNFYYRYWFRVEAEGLENVPSSGGALLVSNHSGALPPDA